MTGNLSNLGLRWVQSADAHRDSGQPAKAAEAYRRALELHPHLASLWVQLGNMLKDSDRYGEAEEAYRVALLRGSDPFDTNLQLGRALQLGGRREAAVKAFITALKASPHSPEAVRELISLGEAWTAQQSFGFGVPAMIEAAGALKDISRALERIERTLPDLNSLASIPPSRWDLWRAIWQVPAAPTSAVKLALFVMADPAPLSAVLDCLTSIERQRHDTLVATILSTDAATRAAVEMRASVAPGRFLPPSAVPTCSGLNALHAVLHTSELADVEWMAVAIEPVLLEPEAAGWLAALAASGTVIGAFADEDTVLMPGDRTARVQAIYTDPQLKGAADPELLDQGQDLGSLIVVHRKALIGAIEELAIAGSREGNERSSWWLELHRKLVTKGAIEHIQHVLSSRIVSVVSSRMAVSPSNQPLSRIGRETHATAAIDAKDVIGIVVLTRDNAGLLSSCIESLRVTADAPTGIAINVVDNGSREAATLEYLDAGSQKRWFQVLRRDEPFNWSQLNNAAVSEGKAPLLVFCNNDIEMIRAGWDSVLRQHLARPEIGVVGARLLYPDRTVQHAGIVLGIGSGGTEHEGRGASADNEGPGGRWLTRRSVAAVTGAFFACRRSDYEAVGGFDAGTFGLWFNDVDFCLKLRARGLRVLYEPTIEAYHHESKTLAAEFSNNARAAHFEAGVLAMRRRWGDAFETDPYFNAHYARWGTPFAWLRPPTRS